LCPHTPATLKSGQTLNLFLESFCVVGGFVGVVGRFLVFSRGGYHPPVEPCGRIISAPTCYRQI
ncbi:MAG: hypothetical protein FWG65_00510, partial [Turicibacter sp.]|nr:hypothetical protein [Turicibacter sp.]